MRLFEIGQDIDRIDLDDEDSFAEGYVVNTDQVQIPNWLAKNSYDPKFVNHIRQYNRVAFFTNMYVADSQRGQGLGNNFVQQFIDEASTLNADAIYLSADTGEIQDSGFDLVKWYENWGWEIIDNSTGYPLMVLIL